MGKGEMPVFSDLSPSNDSLMRTLEIVTAWDRDDPADEAGAFPVSPGKVLELIRSVIALRQSKDAACEMVKALEVEIREAHRNPHPWYGPCDGMGTNGLCASCEEIALRALNGWAVMYYERLAKASLKRLRDALTANDGKKEAT